MKAIADLMNQIISPGKPIMGLDDITATNSERDTEDLTIDELLGYPKSTLDLIYSRL